MVIFKSFEIQSPITRALQIKARPGLSRGVVCIRLGRFQSHISLPSVAPVGSEGPCRILCSARLTAMSHRRRSWLSGHRLLFAAEDVGFPEPASPVVEEAPNGLAGVAAESKSEGKKWQNGAEKNTIKDDDFFLAGCRIYHGVHPEIIFDE